MAVAKSTMSPVSAAFIKKMKKRFPEELKDRKQDDIKAICDAFVKCVVAEVKEGNKVVLTNHFGFKRVERKERKHTPPGSKTSVVKPAHYALVIDVKPYLKKMFEELPLGDGNDEEEVEEEEVEEEEVEEEVEKDEA